MPKLTKGEYDFIKSIECFEDININLDVLKKELDDNFCIDDRLLKQICAALNSGRNVLLTGPPGTGKTTLAYALAKVALNKEPILTTATADWTTFDTIGGYMPDLENKNTNALKFEDGIILESLKKNTWIIVDEINRAPIDKAMGQLFTTLSGGDSKLNYRNPTSGLRYEIKNENKVSHDHLIYKTNQWRMIATMNEYDKMTLFEMSYAFMRRFSLIRIGVPKNYGSLIESWCTSARLENSITRVLKKIATDCEEGNGREVGPSIFLNIIDYLTSRKIYEGSPEGNLLEALSQFLLPQFQGLDYLDFSNVWEILCEEITSSSEKEYFKNQILHIADIRVD